MKIIKKGFEEVLKLTIIGGVGYFIYWDFFVIDEYLILDNVWLFVFTTVNLFAIKLEEKQNGLEQKLKEIKLQNQRLYSLFLQVTKEE